MDLHPNRRNPSWRSLLYFLTGTSVIIFFMTQTSIKTTLFRVSPQNQPDRGNAPLPPPSRRMQDYHQDEEAEQSLRDTTAAGNHDLITVAGAEYHATERMMEYYRNESLSSPIMKILNEERRIIKEAMQAYTFHPALNTKSVNDLILESGGQPVRSLVITTWRSGSTFIGDILQSHPATYYHYEPLLDFDIRQVRHGAAAKQALHNLRHLLTCDYTDMEHYLSYGQTHPWLFLHNQRLWAYCTAFPNVCYHPNFLTPFCRLFPFQSLKTVRLRLNLTTELLLDKKLGVQVLLLVRDPRGTMQSRRHREWCPGNPDCADPALLCRDLVSDFKTAKKFIKRFPNSFKVVRYEDLSFDAYNITRQLFDFFHLTYHPNVKSFLDTHTKHTSGGLSSTFRDSKVAPLHWQTDLAWREVARIQRVCGEAIRVWGYQMALNKTHLRSFSPVGKFDIMGL